MEEIRFNNGSKISIINSKDTKRSKRYDAIKFLEEYSNVKLKWYHKFYIKLYSIFLNIKKIIGIRM
jgi:hypothetical protein